MTPSEFKASAMQPTPLKVEELSKAILCFLSNKNRPEWKEDGVVAAWFGMINQHLKLQIYDMSTICRQVIETNEDPEYFLVNLITRAAMDLNCNEARDLLMFAGSSQRI